MKSFLRCLALITALCVGWSANAQELEEYVYSTGIDASKWITLTDYTDVSGSGSGDSWASTVMSIGFNFPFGDNVYTQYSVNSDGNLRLWERCLHPIFSQLGRQPASRFHSHWHFQL